MRVVRYVSLACLLIAVAVVATSKLWAITPFETDVSTAIDRGVEYLANQGVFANPSSAGDTAGLPMEALLEKRASGNPGDPPQGYNGANATDQARLKLIASYILDRVNETTFYAYRDGQYLFALTTYALTGGPDKSAIPAIAGNADYQTIKQAMDTLTDRVLANQRTAATGFANPINQGYWCYTNNGCEDSSTTQFATAGLASAKAFYSSAASGDAPYADPARVTLINTALGLVKTAYELNALTGSDNSSCNVLTATERGHGYNAKFYSPSLQQTASGIYIQLFGGSNINTPMVQSYLEWERNRYRYTDLDNLGNSWPSPSWSYYMWSSFKGAELLRQSGIAPNPGNLGPNDLGTLPAASAPACNVRQEHKVTAAVARPAAFGAGGVGFYAGEAQSQYFDYAHEILGHQCYDGSLPINGNDGLFNCNSTPGPWETYSHQSYLLLVLQRATGGGCVDTDGDGVCDNVDNCPSVANPNQENTFGGPAGDACEAPPTIRLNVATAPGAGVAGQSIVAVTGASYPAGAIAPGSIQIFVASSCFGPNPVMTTAMTLTTLGGSTRRATFLIPATAPLGGDFVWVVGPGFSSTNCSALTVN